MGLHAGLFVPLDSSGNGMSALDARYALGGLLGTTPRCISGGSISASTTNMQFTVAQSVFELADVDNVGAMALTAFDATVLPAIPAGPTSGSRIDSIIVRQQIVGGSLGDTAPYGLMQTVQGTPSTGTPANPTIPAGWYEYARITVPTNASTASACTSQVLYPAQPAPPILASTNLATLILVPGTIVGQLAWTAEGITYRWNGTTWRPWESDWGPWSAVTTNMGFTGITASWRYRGGKVLGKFVGTWAGNGTGQVTISLPANADTGQGDVPEGRGYFFHGSTSYPLFFNLPSATTLGLNYMSGNPLTVSALTGSAPVTGGSGDVLAFAIEYDRA